jgi:hypothetical protein
MDELRREALARLAAEAADAESELDRLRRAFERADQARQIALREYRGALIASVRSRTDLENAAGQDPPS